MNRFCFMTFFIHHMLFANIGPQGFLQFENEYFVETGTLYGQGVAKALEANFKEILSIEIDQRCVDENRERFAEFEKVKIYQGDTSKDLWNIIKDINTTITFWLDAHTVFQAKNCPVLEELDQIKLHPIKNHTILIDDMHCCSTAFFDFLTKEDFISKILEINPDYKITYVNGGDAGEYPNNVMVAYLPNTP